MFVLICWNFWKTKEPEAQLYKSGQAEPTGDARKQRRQRPRIPLFSLALNPEQQLSRCLCDLLSPTLTVPSDDLLIGIEANAMRL